MWGSGVALAGLLWLGTLPAAAVPGDQGAAVDVVEPGPAPVALKKGSGGKPFWELTVKGDGAYIASWERSSALWGSPEEAGAALKGMYDCRARAILKYANQFSGYAAFNNSPGVEYDPATGLTFTDPATVKKFGACFKESHISSDQVTFVKGKKGTTNAPATVIVQIPAALTGPGTHELFIAKYTLLDGGNPTCPRKTWASSPGIQGGTIAGKCSPTLKDIKKFTVTIPRESSPTVLGGPVVEAGSWFSPSAYSNFRPFDAAGATAGGASGPSLSGLWPAARPALVLGAVLALLLAGSTALLAAGSRLGAGSIAAAVRGVMPAARRGGSRSDSDGSGPSVASNSGPLSDEAERLSGAEAERLPGAAAERLPGAVAGGSAAGTGAGPAESPLRSGFTLPGQVHGPLAFLVLVACSALAAAGQKGFGWNGGSARLALSFLAAFLLLNYGSMLFRWAIVRRHQRGSFPRIAARPVYVAVLLASLAVARMAGLEPALVFGAVLGIDLGLSAKDAGALRPALAAVAGSVFMAVLGLAAWAGYSFLAANHVETFIRWKEIQPDHVAAVSDAGGFTTLAAGELLAVIAVVAVAALPATLWPLSAFEGALIWRWNRAAWVACYIVAVALFSVVLLPWSGGLDGVSAAFAVWVSLYAAYALLAGGLWAVMACARRRHELRSPRTI